MRNFVLDENIILLAAKLEALDGEYDDTCLLVLTEIIKKCDIIHCSYELFARYQKKLNQLEKTKKSASFVTKILINMIPKKKIIRCSDPPQLRREDRIPEDDLFIIRLTAFTGSTLITTDSRLKDKVESERVHIEYNFRINLPDEIKYCYLRA